MRRRGEAVGMLALALVVLAGAPMASLEEALRGGAGPGAEAWSSSGPGSGDGVAGVVTGAVTGLDCDPACNVLVTRAAGPANEVSVAAHPSDPGLLVAVAKDYALAAGPACGARNVWMGLYVSRDGGRTWADTLFPGHPGDLTAPPGALTGLACSSDPVVAFDGGGRVRVAGLGIPHEDAAQGGTQPWTATSDDGGTTWPRPLLLAPVPARYDKPWLGADPGGDAAYAAWTALGSEAVLLTRAVGEAWLPPAPAVTLGPGGPGVVTGFGAVPLALGGEAVLLGWQGHALPPFAVHAARSEDGGLTFGAPATVAEVQPFDAPNTPYPLPAFASWAQDATGGPWHGSVYLAWQGGRAGSPDIWLAASRDGGVTWGAPVRVTDDPPGPAVQSFPALAVGPDGAVHAAWYDRRWDPGNALVDVAHAASRDGGATWSANLRVTTTSSDPTLSFHQNGHVFLGDYIGLAVGADGVAHPAWTDTRNGRADVFTARVLP